MIWITPLCFILRILSKIICAFIISVHWIYGIFAIKHIFISENSQPSTWKKHRKGNRRAEKINKNHIDRKSNISTVKSLANRKHLSSCEVFARQKINASLPRIFFCWTHFSLVLEKAFFTVQHWPLYSELFPPLSHFVCPSSETSYTAQRLFRGKTSLRSAALISRHQFSRWTKRNGNKPNQASSWVAQKAQKATQLSVKYCERHLPY